MANKNKHGLSRTIPSSVKQKVRKDAGFGCILCGSAICEYEHFDPEFIDCKSHNPKGIAYLCPSCHSKKTRGQISVDTIRKAKKSPICIQNGYSVDQLEFGITKPIVQIGGVEFHQSVSIISINGESILNILPPQLIRNKKKHFGQPHILNATFADNNGNEILKIIENEWFGNPGNFDIECKGRYITIRKSIGQLLLKLENIPGKKFIIHNLNMNYKGYKIISTPKRFDIYDRENNRVCNFNSTGHVIGKIAIDIRNNFLIVNHLVLNKIGGYVKGPVSHCTMISDEITMEKNGTYFAAKNSLTVEEIKKASCQQ